MRYVAPKQIRKLRAEMEMKALRLKDVVEVAATASEPISMSRASEVLAGKRVDPAALERLAKIIHDTPMPKEEVAA